MNAFHEQGIGNLAMNREDNSSQPRGEGNLKLLKTTQGNERSEVQGAFTAHGQGIEASMEDQERSVKIKIRDTKKEEELATKKQDGRRDGGQISVSGKGETHAGDQSQREI